MKYYIFVAYFQFISSSSRDERVVYCFFFLDNNIDFISNKIVLQGT